MHTLTFQLKADKCNTVIFEGLNETGAENWTPQGPALFMSFKVETMKINRFCA